MFQIMTEEEIKRADEAALRERVRTLQSATYVLERMVEAQCAMVDQLRRCNGLLAELMNRQAHMAATLGLVEMHVRKRPRKRKVAPPKKHSRKLSTRGR